MPKSLPLEPVARAAGNFVAELAAEPPCRVEANVASPDGMPLLCAIEAVLEAGLPRTTTKELVWLNGAALPDGHVLVLRAFGPENRLLARAEHRFAVAEPAA